MELTSYSDAERFVGRAGADLESEEAVNSLMLGVCQQLAQHPEWFEMAACLKTVEDQEGLVLAAIMTPPHKLVVYAHRGDLVKGAVLLVRNLLHDGWRVPGVLGPSRAAQEVARSWAQVTGRSYELERRQRLYRLTSVRTPVPERGSLRLAAERDLDRVAQWRCEFELELFGRADAEQARRETEFRIRAGDVYLWEDGRPVSMAVKTRPTRRGISVGPVYTPAELRRRGYATACVGELSRLLLLSGRQFCALFADVANASTNQMYQRIGYRPVCDYDEYGFSAEGQV